MITPSNLQYSDTLQFGLCVGSSELEESGLRHPRKWCGTKATQASLGGSKLPERPAPTINLINIMRLDKPHIRY